MNKDLIHEIGMTYAVMADRYKTLYEELNKATPDKRKIFDTERNIAALGDDLLDLHKQRMFDR